jgi:hypothetical protein
MMATEAVKERTMGSNRVTVTLSEETFAKLGSIKNKSFRGRFMALAIEDAFNTIDPKYYRFLTQKDREAVAISPADREQPQPQQQPQAREKQEESYVKGNGKETVVDVDAMEEFK